jgi:hypothetical protein
VPPSRAMSVHTSGNAQTDSVPPSRDMLSVHNTGNVHPETCPPQGEERICCYRKEKEPTEKGTRLCMDGYVAIGELSIIECVLM